VISTSSSQRKLDFAKTLGATRIINYAETPDWDQEVLKLTDGKGVDIVVETGGAGMLISQVVVSGALQLTKI
jgi:NADPH:quinone reductase-like Zn-dependent oxidoreductase